MQHHHAAQVWQSAHPAHKRWVCVPQHSTCGLTRGTVCAAFFLTLFWFCCYLAGVVLPFGTKVLLLDEATSALDAESEHMVQASAQCIALPICAEQWTAALLLTTVLK